MRTLLLPGMDGTGTLFAGLTRVLPGDLDPVVASYSTADALSYDDLVDQLVVPDGEVAIVAESFSGPIGIKLAALLGARARALVLVASFARRPSWVATIASLFGATLFRLPPPRAAVRSLLLDASSSEQDVTEVLGALRSVHPAVLARRLRGIAHVDVRRELARVRCPLLSLRASRDRLVGPSSIATIRDVQPAIELATLDATHLVLQRRPAECARLIAEFIRLRR